MRTTLALAAFAVLTFGAGCARTVDPELVYGSYSVMVSAFGKTDPTVVVAGKGADGVILLNFTHGFTTDYGAINGTGLRVDLDGDRLELAQQPVHVDHSSGEIDGTLTGIGTTGGASLSLTLKVLPSNIILQDANGQPLPAGSTIDYEVAGPKDE
jgi:hypothetical protein